MEPGITSDDVRYRRGTTGADEVRAKLDALLDREAIRELLVAYFRGFEAKRSDDVWLRSIFTEDVSIDFPPGSHAGIAGLGDLTRQILALWDSTLHSVSDHVITLDSGRAVVQAVLHATHVHRADDPGTPLRIGGYVDGEAVRSASGWRFRTLAIRLVWTEGDPPRATAASDYR